MTRPLWFDQYLKSSFTFPKTPDSKLVLTNHDHVPEFQVTPDRPARGRGLYLLLGRRRPTSKILAIPPRLTNSGSTWMASLPS